MGSERSGILCSQLSRRLRAHLGPVVANDNILYPVLHHDGKLRTLIRFAKRGYRLSWLLEAVAIKTTVNGNTVEKFDSSEHGKFVNEAGCEQDLRCVAGRAVRAGKFERAADGHNIDYPCASMETEL
jgi:hypothetical protein